MRDLIINLFGTYQPIEYVTASGDSIIPAGAAGVDWPFVLGVVLFGLFLFCALRMIGGVANAVFRH